MDEVAGAIADPVRREILTMLRAGRMAAGQIADQFAISRPAVSRHLRVLRESGLVHDELTGRQRLYRLDPTPLARLAEWLAPFATAIEPTSAATAAEPSTATAIAPSTATATEPNTATATEPTSAAAAIAPSTATTIEPSTATAWDRRFDALETEVYRTRRQRRGAATVDDRQERSA